MRSISFDNALIETKNRICNTLENQFLFPVLCNTKAKFGGAKFYFIYKISCQFIFKNMVTEAQNCQTSVSTHI